MKIRKRYWPVLALVAAVLAVPLKDLSARRIPCLSGFVRDTGGNAVIGGDLDFIVPATGVKLVTPGDNTDAFGFYNVCVLPGIYDVTYAPPLGTRLMGKRFSNIDLTADIGVEMDVVLETGTVIIGTIADPFSSPIGDVDVDADRLSGGRVFTPDDNSSIFTGVYRIVVPNDTYRIRFEPPIGTRWLGHQIDSVTVAGDVTIDITLTEGFVLSGRVRDIAGNGLPDIDVDLRDFVTGEKVFLAHNTTDVLGDYEVVTPLGLFKLRFEPERGSRFVGALVDSFDVVGDSALDQILQPGVVVSIVVEDSTGARVADVDIDLKLDATGEKIFTPNDKTDVQGTADLTTLPNIYTIQLDPPLGTTFDRLVVPNVAILRDTTLVLELPEVTRVSVTGTVVDDVGSPIPGVEIDANLLPTGTKIFLPNNVTNAVGMLDLAVPIGTYDIFLLPAAGDRFVGAKIHNVVVANDTTWNLILETGVLVTVMVTNDIGAPIANADLDFFLNGSGEEVVTPHDNSDAQGAATVALLPGLYKLIITPPAGSGVAPLTVPSIDILGDQTLSFELERSTPSPKSLLPNFPNPFSAETMITYDVPSAGNVSLAIFDVAGRLVRRLQSGFQSQDTFQVMWDGTNQAGQRVAGGVYFLQLRTTGAIETRKLLLVR